MLYHIFCVKGGYKFMTLTELAAKLGVTPQSSYCGWGKNAKDKRGCGNTGTSTCNTGCSAPSC